MPPSAVSAFPSGNIINPVARWQIILGTQTVQVEPSEVIHIYGPLKTDGYTGISPLDSASQSVDAQTEARIWNTSMMRNGAKPSMTVTTPDEMTPTRFQAFKAKLNASFAGGRNAGRIMLLDGGKTATYDGFSAKDMDYSAGITLTAREICLALGVPPELAGDSANKTYANAQEAHREFAINTVAPIANQYFEALSGALCVEGDIVARIGFDASQIEGMKSDESALISALTACDFLSDNEKRARLSYDSIPDGDIILTGMGKVPRSEIVSDPMEMLNDNREDLL
jgi:HK97 family phage portal protein